MDEAKSGISIDALRILASQANLAAPCEVCGPLRSPGWESMPDSFDRSRLRKLGSLWRDDGSDGGRDEEATLLEHHPNGTHIWSDDAPIAPAFFPYNRSEVCQCMACSRLFLRYTEYGGYYHDDRIRALRLELIDDTPL